MEIIVTPENRWYTVGDNGAEFTRIPKNSIVFNHKQTEELLRNGKVTSGGGRAKALVNGTAFLGGTSYANTDEFGGDTVGKNDSDKFEETFDWLDILLSRLERTIDNLDKTVSDSSKSWTTRNNALADEITEVGNLIGTIGSNEDSNSIAGKYWAQAEKSLSHDSDLAKMIRGETESGAFNIELYEGETDESTLEKIKEYQKWYELYLDMIDKAEDLKQTEAELYEQRFENVQSQYDSVLQGFEHTESMLEEYIKQTEAKGHIVSTEYYDALINSKNNEIAVLQKEQSDLIAKRDEAVASGAIVQGSQAWYDMCAEIDDVTLAIEAAKTQTIEWANEIRNIEWEVFDQAQERISDIIDEADFLIELMSYDKLHNDDGSLTDKGMATMGQHGVKYNAHMFDADEYGKEIAKLDSQIAEDPYDQELINRRRELISLQRESILAAEDEKEAMRDLVEEGINLELDALQELIDKKNEELESEKD